MESTPSPHALSVSPTSLAAAFAGLPDPRRAASVRYPLPVLLALAVAAILANQHSVLAIAEWASRQDADLLIALGFPNGRTPCQSTLQRLFRQLDGRALASCLTRYFAPSATPPPPDPAAALPPQGIAIDGKAQRGRLRFAGGGCPVHALSAFCHDHGIVLAHEPIAAATETERGEAELTVAPLLVERIDWTGRVLTGDALFCQRALCQQVRAAGGDYLVLVKENQGTLYRDIELLFDPPPAVAALPLLDRRATRTVETGHGRQGEVREVIASTDLVDYLDWPGHAQVFRVERSWQEHGHRKRARHYGITSLAPALADPARLLALKRGHWAIENRLHRCKDVTFGEDASLIHAGQGPTVMALLRDAAVNVLHLAGIRQIAAQLRRHSQFPAEAVALVIDPPPTHAKALPDYEQGIDNAHGDRYNDRSN
jgi:predicted transposase YbfD/YdcC